jgi:SAM-dependent methyltransferase
MFILVSPDMSTVPLPANDGEIPCRFGYPVFQKDGVADLLGSGDLPIQATAKHYTEQWGPEIAFCDFIEQNPAALQSMPSGQLGWPRLFARLRERACDQATVVFDAGCGYGGIFRELFAQPVPKHLAYLGADIHRALSFIKRPSEVPLSIARFVRWDISEPLPFTQLFDCVICRNALMHTLNPAKTLRSLVVRLAPAGTIAVSVYARKPLLREVVDDALRARIIPLAADDALTLARQFTRLGRDLQASDGKIIICQDLPFLGIRRGEYSVHDFLYNHVIKCWYNAAFGEKYSDVVNFDWYHPPYAYRYTRDEIVKLFEELGLRINEVQSIPAQHYIEATKVV